MEPEAPAVTPVQTASEPEPTPATAAAAPEPDTAPAPSAAAPQPQPAEPEASVSAPTSAEPAPPPQETEAQPTAAAPPAPLVADAPAQAAAPPAPPEDDLETAVAGRAVDDLTTEAEAAADTPLLMAETPAIHTDAIVASFAEGTARSSTSVTAGDGKAFGEAALRALEERKQAIETRYRQQRAEAEATPAAPEKPAAPTAAKPADPRAVATQAVLEGVSQQLASTLESTVKFADAANDDAADPFALDPASAAAMFREKVKAEPPVYSGPALPQVRGYWSALDLTRAQGLGLTYDEAS